MYDVKIRVSRWCVRNVLVLVLPFAEVSLPAEKGKSSIQARL